MVFTGWSVLRLPMPPTSGGPPASGGAAPPSPLAPWHPAPKRAKSSSPCWTVPLPGGSPVPSAATSMSHPAICSGVAGLPKPNCPSGVDIAHLSIDRDGPRFDGVVVKYGVDPAGFHQLGDGRLHVAGLVDGPALDLRHLAIPHPGEAKAGPGHRQHRLLQRRRRPALPAVG